MKRILVSLIVCLVFLTGNLVANAQSADPAQVVAKVNGEEILQSDVDSVINLFVMPQFQAQNPGQELPPDQLAKIEESIIGQLVTQRLLLQAAANAGITVDEELVDRRLEAVKAQQPDMPLEQVREFIANDFLIQQVIQQEIIAKISVTDEEAQNVYNEQKDQFNEAEQVRASHILVQVAPDAPQEKKDEAREKIEMVLALAQEGNDFAELAKEHSEGPSKDNGGDLGFFPRGAMVPSFEEAAFALQEGEISPVVETQFGYHIIKVTGHKDQRQVPFEEIKDQLKQSVIQQKSNTEAMKWIGELKESATIEMMNQESATN
jgi:peptidyl-prolyl cis-trans isomerase C